MLRTTWADVECPVCSEIFPKGTQMHMEDITPTICDTCWTEMPEAVKEIAKKAMENFRARVQEQWKGKCEWRFTDYTKEDGAFACQECGEDAVLCYVRDSVDGLETYCNTCVLVEYPDLDLGAVPIELPD